MERPFKPMDDKVVAEGFRSGELWASLDHVALATNPEPSVRQLSRLHNQGDINLFDFDVSPIRDLPSHRRYGAMRLLTQTLARVDGEAEAILALFDRIGSKLGDAADYDVAHGLRLWCRAHSGQAAGLVDEALEGDARAVRFLAPILMGGDDLERMHTLARSGEVRWTEPALRALAGTEHSDADAVRTVALLKDLAAQASDDNTRALLVKVFFEAVVKRQAETLETQRDTLETLLNAAGPETLHDLIYGLFVLGSPPGPSALDLCLPLLKRLESDRTSTLELLDHVLAVLVSAGQAPEAAEVVFSYASRDPDPVALSVFDSFAHAVFSAPPDVAGRLLPDWLSRGNDAVSAGLSGFIQGQDRSRYPLAASFDPNLSDGDLYFTCRQAIGWFLIEEVVAASIVVAALRQADADLAEALVELLVEALLLNYDGDLITYLNGLTEDDPATRFIQSAREKADAYRAGLSGDWVRELTPSQSRQQLAHNQRVDAMRQTRREGRKRSIFADLVSSQHILFTDRVTTYWVKPDGSFEVMESQLEAFSYSYEQPRQDVLDPVGLSMLHFELCHARPSRP